MGAAAEQKEQRHNSRATRWLHDLWQDIGYATRTLLQIPAFTLGALLVLALAIGSNTAVFTVVTAVLLRPLPFPEADRLFLVSIVPKGLFFDPGPIMVDRDYLEFKRHNHSFESLAALGSASGQKVTLTRRGEPAILTAFSVDPDFCRVLRAYPALGRTFLPGGMLDDHAVLLSHRLWLSRFSGNSNAISQNILLDGVSYTIAGVMPPTFTFQGADLWMRSEFKPDPHRAYFIPVLGRLKPGVLPRQAQAELATFASHLPADPDLSSGGYAAQVLPLRDLFVGKVRKLLLIFAGAVALVYLIACANFANLLLIRGAGRQPELAVRAAFGASRSRLVRQLITESTLLSLGGTLLGLLLSAAGVPTLLALLPQENIPLGANPRVDLRVLLFAIGLSVITGLVFGLLPALQVTRRELRQGVSEGGRNVLVRRDRLRGVLVAIEIALALILLAGAGLLLRSFLQIRSVNPGFQPANLAVATADLPSSRYKSAAKIQAFHRNVLSALASLPAAKSVAAVSFLPFGYGVAGNFKIEDGRPLPNNYRVDKPAISASYFKTLGIPILHGRGFNRHDDSASLAVAVISESVARRLWPAGDAVGKRVAMQDHPEPADWLTIVGIAGDVRQQGFADRTAAIIYQPYQQIKSPSLITHMSFVVQSDQVQPATAGLRNVIRRLDRDLPVESITTMDAIVAKSLTAPQAQTRLLMIFSVAALLLAAIGIYGVMACSVAERTHEIGIRMAVGAAREDILWMVLRRALSVTTVGVLAGVAGALALTRVLEKFLFEVTATDPLTFFTVIGLLLSVALLSAFIPARRAAQVQPLEALRHS